jgi:lysophospholipase L1-like esterase
MQQVKRGNEGEIMTYFAHYISNTIAGSGNQSWFSMPLDEIRTGRVFYKITAGGEYSYSLLFSNIMDSTFSKGDHSYKNLLCEEWQIHAARVGKCCRVPFDKPLDRWCVEGANADASILGWQTVTFDGHGQKTVKPGEFFSSDPVLLSFEKGEYLCLELTFSGGMLPYHHESMLPIYIKGEDGWHYDVRMPLPGMIGCDRPVKARIAYFGDSITQGLGTPYNAYLHWNALLSERLGEEYAFWNLGLGFGRAEDAASGGAWMYKAKQNDVVVVCFGVNDIFHSGQSAAQIAGRIEKIVQYLTDAGVKVVLQTVPPFDYNEPYRTMWQEINAYIRESLRDRVALLFDNVAVLGKSQAEPHMAKHGGHPNAAGCAVWAEAFYEPLAAFLKNND